MARDRERAPRGPPLEVGELRIDSPSARCACAATTIQATFVEFEILARAGAQPRPRVHARHAADAHLGRLGFRDPRTIDVHIRHLREKLERDAKEPEYLFTVRGVGYRFRDTDD